MLELPTAYSWDLLYLWALTSARFPVVRPATTAARPIPFSQDEPIVIALIPLHEALLVFLLAGCPLEDGSNPSLLPVSDHLVNVLNVLFVLVKAHGVHLLLFLQLFGLVHVSLKDF